MDARYTVTPRGVRFTVGKTMTTGRFWNIASPNKPWGPLDQQSVLEVPIDWDDWLAEIGHTYGSHSLDPDPLLDVSDVRVMGGTIFVSVKFNSAPVIGTYYPLRCHIVTAETPPAEEDQTLWFKAVAK